LRIRKEGCALIRRVMLLLPTAIVAAAMGLVVAVPAVAAPVPDVAVDKYCQDRYGSDALLDDNGGFGRSFSLCLGRSY
jgi:hypothetical protein